VLVLVMIFLLPREYSVTLRQILDDVTRVYFVTGTPVTN